jgi:uncharacterized protein YndB with AHSA1/START domain
MIVTAEVHIRRDPRDVFDFLATHSNHPRFIVENVSSKQVSPGAMAVGTRVENVARVMGREMVERFEIVEIERPRVIAKSSREGSTFETTDRFDLRADGDGTHVRITVTGTPRGLGQRMLLVVIEPIMARSMRKALGRLKDILEREEPAVAASA